MDDSYSSLKESLKFQLLFGIDLTFDYIVGRDYYNNFDVKNKCDFKDKENCRNNNYGTKSIKPDNSIEDNPKKYNNSKNDISNSIVDEDKNSRSIDIDNSFNSNQYINLNNIDTFDNLVEEIRSFNGCNLRFGAKNSVIFDGNKEAKIMLIGEAPGENEDEKGIPFCGQSGQLLRKALGFIHLNTENMLITNTVYWRPPMNRKPDGKELSICFPFVKKMIEIIRPNVVILCGSTAIRLFLKSDDKMEKMTGKAKKIGVKNNNYFVLNSEEEINNMNCDYSFLTFSIYHPSYLLRNPSMKKTFWRHLLLLSNTINSFN